MKKRGVTGILSRTSPLSGRELGFTLLELIIAMAVGLIVLGAMYSVFTVQNKTFNDQERIVNMQQNVRAAMDMMTREIGLAGYDPARVNSDASSSNNFVGVTYSTSQLQIQADLDGNGTIDTTSQENITYAFDSTNRQITRNAGTGAQTFVDGIESFAFEYLDGGVTATTISANIRQVRITIEGRSANYNLATACSAISGCRTYTLSTVIAPRNLAY